MTRCNEQAIKEKKRKKILQHDFFLILFHFEVERHGQKEKKSSAKSMRAGRCGKVGQTGGGWRINFNGMKAEENGAVRGRVSERRKGEERERVRT